MSHDVPFPYKMTGTLEWHCPKCGVLLNGRMSLDDEGPRAGDISFCLHCLAMMFCESDHQPVAPAGDRSPLVWRLATLEEREEFLKTPLGYAAWQTTCAYAKRIFQEGEESVPPPFRHPAGHA